MSLTAVILCGGRSSRMGQDKSALPFGDETMLGRVTRVAGSVAEHVIVVGRRDQPHSTAWDAMEDQGPLAGLAAGLSASTTEMNVVVACDMPLVRPEVLQRLVDAMGDADICVAMVDGQPSVLCGIYRSRLAPVVQSLLDRGERRVKALLEHANVQRVDASQLRDIDPELDTFVSVDTADRYRWALARS